MKNILFIETSSGFGGSGNSLAQLLTYLDRSIFYPIVVVFNKGPQFEKIKNCGVGIIRLKFQEFEPELSEGLLSYFKFCFDLLFNILPLTLKLVSVIKTYRINLVHINNNIISGIPAIIAAKISGVACISHIRQTRRLIRREQFFARWVDRLIVINKEAKQMHAQDVTKEKLVLIYNGIDLERYDAVEDVEGVRKEFNLDSLPCVGIVGRLVEGKGHDDFIKAASIVRKIMPKTKFLIVGSDTPKGQAVEKGLRALAKRLNLGDSLIFAGWRDDIPQIISAFDILVQASSFFPEGFGLTTIEAMALKKPVIVTAIAGLSEVVIDEQTGYIVPPANPQALAKAILKILGNPEQGKRMGEAGRKRVEKEFSIQRKAKNLEQLYEELWGK